MSNWIRCSEKTPPSGVPLLLCNNGVVQRAVYDYDPTGDTWQDWYEELDPFKIDPAYCHYQLLPGPPKEGE